jgi:hypothetical protein
MNELEAIRVPGAREIAVRLAGEWVDADRREWRGAATAEEELAGLLLLRGPGVLHWTRSRNASATSLTIRLRIGPDTPEGTWFWAEIGDAHCWDRVDTPVAIEIEGEEEAPVTGGLVRLARIVPANGKPPLEVNLLLLARSDVRYGRKRIWRLRPALRSGLESLAEEILVTRRFGGYRF